MAEYTPKTISELLKEIEEERVILPAMQRNFVWSEDKICKLFESLMKDYPIGTFLFWKVDKEVFDQYAFNTFIRDYDEQLGKMQRGSKATKSFSDYMAVLDGQQRITSLYMGIRGKYRTHIKGKEWKKTESYFDRFLCIDVLFMPKEDEEYKFAFVPKEVIGDYSCNEEGVNEYWIRVSDIFDKDDISDLPDIIDDIPDNPTIFPLDARKDARKAITALYKALHVVQNINYYLAKEKTLAEVVDIFVRVNSGGQKLDASDLMLSVAASEQGNVDIHVLIQDAVEEINSIPNDTEKGFNVDKELLLTAGLLLTGAKKLSLKSNENWTSSRMNEIFKDHWDRIIESLECTVDYIEYLGFIGKKIGRNTILPIAYYFYKNNLNMQHKNSSSKRAACDRVFIRQWLIRSIVNGVFIDGTGTTLLAIRQVLDKTTKKHFPLEDLIQARIKKPLTIGDEQIDDILDIKYGDTRVIPFFAELEHRAARQNDQVDHIWAKSILSSKKKIKKLYPAITEDELNQYKQQRDRLANLQLLDSVENNEKLDTPFDEWVSSKFPTQQEKTLYTTNHFIPEEVEDELSYGFQDFMKFIECRETLLREKIKEAFPSDFDDVVKRNNLQDKLD